MIQMQMRTSEVGYMQTVMEMERRPENKFCARNRCRRHVTNGGDCDDSNADVDFEVGYADSDGDGKGDPKQVLSCGTDVEGYVTNGGDCDDSNADVLPKLGVC